MASTNLRFPFDPEIFNYEWKNAPDMVLTSMINSGAVVYDSEIERLISNGSNFFTTPYYDVLSGTQVVYNGSNDASPQTNGGGVYSGVVYGRMASWKAESFIKDFNSGADPMAQIVAGVANYWAKARQDRLIGILGGIFGISSDTDWALHTTNLATTTTTVADSNKIGETTINDAMVKANGDACGGYSLAIMHSVVANRLATLQLLNYSKYTDASGITRSLPLATINGLTVIINDNVPVSANATATTSKDYVTYLLGQGSIRFASAPVGVPSEMERDPQKAGGLDLIHTRIRECIMPYGFSFKGSTSTDVGIPDATLFASASWERKMPAKSVMLCKIVTNG